MYVLCRTCVNGTMIDSLVHLWHGDRILWGNNHFFRYESFVFVATFKRVNSYEVTDWIFALLSRINLPKRKRRDRLKELERASPRESFVEADIETASEASSEQDYTYEFAQMEVIMKTLGNNGMIGIMYIFYELPAHSRNSDCILTSF